MSKLNKPMTTTQETVEEQVYIEMLKQFGKLIHPIDNRRSPLEIYVLCNGDIFKPKKYNWEETQLVPYFNKDLVYLGNFEPQGLGQKSYQAAIRSVVGYKCGQC